MDNLAALCDRASTAELCNALRAVAALDRMPEAPRMQAWLIGELERRHPAASEAVQQAFEQAEHAEQAGAEPVDVDYVAVLVTAIEQGTSSAATA